MADPLSSSSSGGEVRGGGGGRPWVLNADGTRGAPGAVDEEGEEMEEDDNLASPDTLLARILRPTTTGHGPPAPFAGFEVCVVWM
jgi:hypothetical protein